MARTCDTCLYEAVPYRVLVRHTLLGFLWRKKLQITENKEKYINAWSKCDLFSTL